MLFYDFKKIDDVNKNIHKLLTLRDEMIKEAQLKYNLKYGDLMMKYLDWQEKNAK
jgi:hypothetical protein